MLKILLLVLLVPFNILFGNVEITSLQAYTGDDQTSMPLLDFNDGASNSLTIEFDINAEYEPNLIIRFRLCDKNWNPYNNLFLENQGYNTAYNLWYDRLPNTVSGAVYHFKGSFPNYDVTFPYSGKWMFYITDSHNTDEIYASGKFYVVYPEVVLNASLQTDRIERRVSIPNYLDRTYALNINFTLPDTLFPSRVGRIEVVENHKVNNPIILTKRMNDYNRYFETDGARNFTFVARDIFPGNEYRTADLRDNNHHYPPTTDAQYDGIETDRSYMLGEEDLNGGSRINDFNDVYSEYMYVVFKIRPPENFNREIFLTGSFNNWEVKPECELFENDGLYKISVELKRGVYDYQFVTGDNDASSVVNIDWYELEGNFWDTNNNYYIFLYYSAEQNGGYDKIIGYIKISSENV